MLNKFTLTEIIISVSVLHILVQNIKGGIEMPFTKRSVVDEREIFLFSKNTGTHPMWAEIFISRGITSKESASDFIKGGPFLIENFKNCRESSNLIKEGIKENKRFLIYGDYDQDGCASVSIMLISLKKLGANVSFFIPSRFTEGYGISDEVLRDKVNDFDFFISVDTGITAVEQTKYLKQMGKTVIITDHHTFSSEVPPADFIIHPFLEEKKLNICGAFVAYHLSIELLGYSDFYLQFLAALATVADQMPLVGINRNLIIDTISTLKTTKPMPIPIIFSETEDGDIKDWQFSVIPMVNSAGRMGSANVAVHFLTSTDREEALHYFNILKKTNEERKSVSGKIKESAISYIKENHIDSDCVMVVPLEDSHEGVNGIVASSVLGTFHKPALVLFKNSLNTWVGSGRSHSIDLYSFLNKYNHLFDTFGGHSYAVGFRISDLNLKKLIEEIKNVPPDSLPMEAENPYDIEIDINRVNEQLVTSKNLFSPFGQGNPDIIFLSIIEIASITPLKDGKYFKISVKGNKSLSFLFWEPFSGQFEEGSTYKMAYNIEDSQFRGKKSVKCTPIHWEKVL